MSGPGATVTVVIPVWDDYVEFLTDAVESVRRCAPQAPIVVVDNASSAAVPELGSCEIVRSPERLTVGAARNLGLDRVATEYVLFLDADDMLLEGTLDFLQEGIDADPSLAVCATSILDGATGERHRTPRRFAARLARWPKAFALIHTVWSLLPIQGCAILRTRQVREAGGYPDAHLGDDWVLAVSLVWRGRVTVSDQLGRYYRYSEGSIAGRQWTRRELRSNARLVRERMRLDPAVPSWARALLPVITVLHLAVIHLGRPVYLALRGLATRGPSNIR